MDDLDNLGDTPRVREENWYYDKQTKDWKKGLMPSRLNGVVAKERDDFLDIWVIEDGWTPLAPSHSIPLTPPSTEGYTKACSECFLFVNNCKCEEPKHDIMILEERLCGSCKERGVVQ